MTNHHFLQFSFFVLALSDALKLAVLQLEANKTLLCTKAIEEAKNDGNCGSEQIELIYRTACNGNDQSAKGTTNAIQLEYTDTVNAFVGPFCEDESMEIGRMAYFWKTPFFSRSVQSTPMLDLEIYPNTVSTTLTTAAGLIRSVFELYNQLNGTLAIHNISLIGPSSRNNDHYPLAQAIMDYLTVDPILEVPIFNLFDERGSLPSTIKENIEANGSKLLVVATDFEYSEFVKSLDITNWYNNGFIVVLLSLDPVFEIRTQATRKEIVDSKAIVISPNVDNLLLANLTKELDLSEAITPNQYHIRFSLFLSCYSYCFATKQGVAANTQDFYNAFRNRQISTGRYGVFRFDGEGSYLQNYLISRLITEPSAFDPLAYVNTNPLSSCQGPRCFETTFSLLPNVTYFEELKKVTKAACTYTNTCSSTWLLGWILAIVFFILAILFSLFVRYWHKKRSINQYRMHWKLRKEEVKIIENKASRMGNKGELSAKKRTISSYALINTSKAEFLAFHQSAKIKWSKQELKYLFELRQLNNDNLNRFVGLVCNERDVNHTGRSPFYVLSNMVERASLEDFIIDSEFGMDITFKSSFMRDIIKGLIFLHKSAVGYHGLLTSANCLIDAYWVLKLTNFGVTNMVHEFINQKCLEVAEALPYQYYLSFAPENMVQMEITRNYPKGSPQGDMYSLGIIMFQILYRHNPYEHCGILGRADAIQKIMNYTWTPAVTDPENQDPALIKVIEQCWVKNPDSRPKMKEIRKVVETSFASAKGQLVDQMLDLNEKYASNLEKIVAERNSMLQEAQEQTLRLLNEMLPKSVASVLVGGGTVEPRYYEEATVLFAQLCEFSQILKNSTPDQVIFFLNDIFEMFDQVISRHDAYKVETTGETYMVVSGVPNENGGKHITEIADISLEIREVSWTYKIEHLVDMKVRCKIGFHCGPIASGVIGNVAPRFCLFGDTVNFSSRMQSNCPPNQIQTSEVSAMKLMKRSEDYKLDQRGIVQVKGKGAVNCYWLNEHVHLDEPPPSTSHGRNRSISQLPAMPPKTAEPLSSIAENEHS